MRRSYLHHFFAEDIQDGNTCKIFRYISDRKYADCRIRGYNKELNNILSHPIIPVQLFAPSIESKFPAIRFGGLNAKAFVWNPVRSVSQGMMISRLREWSIPSFVPTKSSLPLKARENMNC